MHINSFPFPAICSLDVDAGTCSDYDIWYYYNSTEDSCRQFYYSGCDGNANRYLSDELCDSSCRSASREEIGIN